MGRDAEPVDAGLIHSSIGPWCYSQIAQALGDGFAQNSSDDVGKLIPDATVREQVQAALVAKQQELTKQANDYEQARVLAETDIQKAQIAVDQTQVTSTDKFIAYARPAAIRVGVVGLLYASVISSMIGWFDTIFNWPGKVLTLDTTITCNYCLDF